MISYRTLRVLELVIKFGHMVYVFPFVLESDPHHRLVLDGKVKKLARLHTLFSVTILGLHMIYMIVQSIINYIDYPTLVLSAVMAVAFLAIISTHILWLEHHCAMVVALNNYFRFNRIQGNIVMF